MKTIYLISALTLIASCAHHKDVRLAESGIHSVQLHTEDKQSGYDSAISQANHYCKTLKKKAYTVKEGHTYSGNLDEKDYHKGKTISKIAKGIGGAGIIFGGKREQGVGGVLGVGGHVSDSVLGHAYTYVLKFKCK